MEKVGDMFDIVIVFFGGGFNFVGLFFLFLCLNLEEGKNIWCIVSELVFCLKFMRGIFCYDFGDIVGMILFLLMYILGYNFVFVLIYVGGLCYYGVGVIVS